MTPALVYVRVSGRAQADGDGPKRQRQAVGRYATAHDLEIIVSYQDLGVSGTKELADREGMAALLAHVQDNGVRVVLVERADRLARDLVVSELLLQDLRRSGAQVIECEGGTDLAAANDPTRKLIRQVLGAVAEFDRDVLVLKLRAARQRKADKLNRKSVEGAVPFGHPRIGKHSDGKPYPGEAEILEHIYALARKRPNGIAMNPGEIARQLNADGISTRTGGDVKWQDHTVRRILARKRTSCHAIR